MPVHILGPSPSFVVTGSGAGVAIDVAGYVGVNGEVVGKDALASDSLRYIACDAGGAECCSADGLYKDALSRAPKYSLAGISCRGVHDPDPNPF